MGFLPQSPVLRPLRSTNVLIVSGVCSVFYVLIQLLTLNSKLVEQTLMGAFPLSYKLRLLGDLVIGYFTMFPPLELFFSLLTALFVGLNLALIIALMQNMKRSGDMKLSFGGVSVLALASSGCPGCGLTIFSLLGPSSGVLAVTMHSFPIQLAMLGLLLFSSVVSLKRLQSSTVCKR